LGACTHFSRYENKQRPGCFSSATQLWWCYRVIMYCTVQAECSCGEQKHQGKRCFMAFRTHHTHASTCLWFASCDMHHIHGQTNRWQRRYNDHAQPLTVVVLLLLPAGGAHGACLASRSTPARNHTAMHKQFRCQVC
jgi:hypothetical protein